jgi:hypothetical protein
MREVFILAAIAFALWLLEGWIYRASSAPPKPHEDRTPFRFSLRQLFVVITAVAVLLGLAAFLLPRVH